MTILSSCVACGKNALRDPDSSFCGPACAAKYTSMISGQPLYMHTPPKGQHFEAKMRDDIVYTLNDDAMKIGIQPGAGDFAMTDWKEPDPFRSILDSLIGRDPAKVQAQHPGDLIGWECPVCHDIYENERRHPFCDKAMRNDLKRRQGYIPLSDTEVNDAVRRFLPHTLVATEKEIDRLRTKVCHLEIEIFTLKADLDHCRRCHQG